MCCHHGMRWYRFLSTVCIYSSAGNRVSDWWLFLCLAYISCLVVGVIFIVAGFSSLGFDMAAVGLVLIIAGACLAIVCDLLRRFGCGWTKNVSRTVSPGRTGEENSAIVVNMPYLPGYPGFCASTEDSASLSDIPPSYETSTGQDEMSASSPVQSATNVVADDTDTEILDATSGASETSSEMSPRLEQLPLTEVSENTGAISSVERCHPPPPPYNIVVADNNQNIICLIRDSPPPYTEFV